MVASWLQFTTLTLGRPDSSGLRTTVNGYVRGGSVRVIAATIVVRLWAFPTSF